MGKILGARRLGEANLWSSPPLRRSCVSVGLLLEDESNRWWFSSSTKYRIDCCSPPRRRRIKSSVALLIDEESNHRWLLSRRKHSYVAGPQIERLRPQKKRDGVIEEHDLQVKRLEDKITQLIGLVLLLPRIAFSGQSGELGVETNLASCVVMLSRTCVILSSCHGLAFDLSGLRTESGKRPWHLV
ncbi:hypothetical protein Bca52824_084871 [Brassica carinata]|uniref:Uncharacterized protein n=1 Tax=Brassica carinata TaxID=52824 RepID=A0A8X7PNI8_BRACI|nr:hypothetical protein Bca52824_084871 [Brassica carinata]